MKTIAKKLNKNYNIKKKTVIYNNKEHVKLKGGRMVFIKKEKEQKEKSTRGKKEGFMQGVVTLMFSQVLIKILGLVYTLYLTNRPGFGDKGNGICASGYQIYALLLTISSIGLPSAISKLVSERTAVGDNKGANRIFKIAFATFAIIGLVGSLLLFFGAKVIANNWLQIPEAEMTLVSLSPAVFFVTIASVMRGYFNGRQKISIGAKSQTLEQVFKTLLTIIIVEVVAILSNVSTEWMAAGANLATTLATFLGFSYLFLYYKSERKEIATEIKNTVNYQYERVSEVIKKILFVSIPITLTAIMSSINKNVDSFTVVRNLKKFLPEDIATAQYGILGGKVDTLTSLPLAINVAFATALVPAISAAKARKDKKTITEKTSFSLLISMLIGLPCTVGMFIFAGPILSLLFPNASAGEAILQISSLTIIFTILDQTINGALQGYGKLMIPTIAFGCRSTCKTGVKFNTSTKSSIWSMWSSMGISSMPCNSIYNSKYSIKEKYKIEFINVQNFNKTSNSSSNYGNMLIFYIFCINRYNCQKIGYTNSNNSSNYNLCISNNSIKSIFKRRNITIT